MKLIKFSKIGKREVNQDYVLVQNINPETSLFLVVDGMGGYTDGEIAAQLVAENILTYLSTTKEVDVSQIQNAINKANLAIKQHSEKINDKVGATVAGTIIINNKAICFWIGDVKVLHFKNNKLITESVSHNLMNEVARNGSITDVKRLKKYQHVVTRSVQGDVKLSQVDYFEVEDINHKDMFIICSDGVHNLYEGLQFQHEINSSESYEVAFNRVEKRLTDEARDNFSLICVYDFESNITKDIQPSDKSASTRWEKSNISYINYLEYIESKTNRFNLTIVDLLYISNFKGGNASIHEKSSIVNKKLELYSEKLLKINDRFNNRKLEDLSEEECNDLTELVRDASELCENKTSTKIDGFGPSYLSAIMNAYFPNLIPILDRRVLINLKLVRKTNLRSGQILKIEDFYAPLIKKFAELSKKNTNESFRDIDRKYFSMKLDIESLE